MDKFETKLIKANLKKCRNDHMHELVCKLEKVDQRNY